MRSPVISREYERLPFYVTPTRDVLQFVAHEYRFIPALVGREFTGSMACLPYSKANRIFDINQTGALKDVDGGGVKMHEAPVPRHCFAALATR